MKENYYNDFKNQLKQNAPVYREMPEPPPMVAEVEQPVEAQPEVQPVSDIKGNGHKDVAEVVDTMPDEPKDLAKEIADTRHDMLEAEKTKNIPGNGYLFNRDPRHKLETSIINMLQLHNYVVAKIQTTVLKPDWDSSTNMVADMYVENMLEGSIAVDGKAREQFVALTQFKNDERAQAAHGSLFGTGPNG
jgi:hypothetical protein